MPASDNNLEAAVTLLVEKSLKKILSSQNADGSFFSESVQLQSGHIKKKRTIFFNAEILYQLTKLPPSPDLKVCITNLSNFLLSQKSSNGSFNYWAEGEPDRLQLPNDIDDTACALIALSNTLPTTRMRHLVSSFVSIIKYQHVKEGFSTWIPASKYEIDVDPVVQLNVSAVFSLFTASNINQRKKLHKEWWKSSLYYKESFLPSFFAARAGAIFYSKEVEKELSSPTSPWQLGLALLSTEKEPEKRHVRYIISKQQEDALWRSELTIFEGRTRKKEEVYSKSDLLCSCAILNILCRWLERQSTARISKSFSIVSKRYNTAPPQLLKLLGDTPYYLNFLQFLVCIPVLVSWNTSKRSKKQITQIVSNSFSALIAIDSINKIADRKPLSISGSHVVESLLELISLVSDSLSSSEERKVTLKQIKNLLSPPQQSEYEKGFLQSYLKRVQPSFIPLLIESRINHLNLPSTAVDALSRLIIVRSISDDVLDHKLDESNNNFTGITMLIKMHGYTLGIQKGYGKVTSYTEDAMSRIYAESSLHAWWYTLNNLLNEPYKTARANILATYICEELGLSLGEQKVLPQNPS